MDSQIQKDSAQHSNSKPKRRLRTDQNNRDYTCGCGKSYLSYPALYTHLKQKHNGKAPNGTVLPNNLGPKGNRGRPKREDHDRAHDEKSQSSNQPEETIEELLLFLDTLGFDYRNDIKYQDLGSIIKYLIHNFPTDIIEPKSPIFTQMKEILQKKDEEYDLFDNLIEESVEDPDKLRKTNINKIFAYFLIDLGYRLSIGAYEEMVVYIHMFQRGLEEIGYYDQENKSLSFCQEEKGDRILIIANEFILQLLPKYFQELGTTRKRTFTIFGSTDDKLKNAVYITQHFSQWLYAHKFTNSRLALFTEEDE